MAFDGDPPFGGMVADAVATDGMAPPERVQHAQEQSAGSDGSASASNRITSPLPQSGQDSTYLTAGSTSPVGARRYRDR